MDPSARFALQTIACDPNVDPAFRAALREQIGQIVQPFEPGLRPVSEAVAQVVATLGAAQALGSLSVEEALCEDCSEPTTSMSGSAFKLYGVLICQRCAELRIEQGEG